MNDRTARTGILMRSPSVRLCEAASALKCWSQRWLRLQHSVLTAHVSQYPPPTCAALAVAEGSC